MAPSPLAGLRRKRVVVLPDIFIDALGPLPVWNEAGPKINAIANRGGGNLPIGPVEFKLGGNAANTALALARLGANVDLIAETDELGSWLLERAAKGTTLKTTHVRIGKRASATLGLEGADANVMLSHAGPLLQFGPERLRPKDWKLLENADAVAFVNWAQNQRGTQLLRRLSSRLGKKGVFLYFDSADPHHRLADARALLKDAVLWQGVGAWGLNENELRAFSGDARGDPIVAAQKLSRRLDVRLDVHARRWAACITPGSTVKVEGYAAPARRLTGAGDVWNAGNLAGYLLGWGARERLRLAHRVATKYVTGRSGVPPRADEVR